MRLLSHPVRLDGSGGFATVTQDTDQEARQAAAVVVSTFVGERPLAPDFGIYDPVAVGTSTAEVVAALALSEPDLEVLAVAIDETDGRQTVTTNVRWVEAD